MSDPFRLDGRRALVTGASRGIGLAIAREFGRRGARVVITGRKSEALQGAMAESEELLAKAEVCNQGDASAAEQLFARLDEQRLAPEILVVNAATNPVYGPLLDCDLEAWRKVMEVNLTGAFTTARLAARRMIHSGSGSIIFIASVVGLDPAPGLGAYGVSKAGLMGLMRVLAKELGQKGVRVNAIAPGLIETRFSSALFADEQSYRRFVETTALGKHGQPEDVVGAAVFLASEASAYVTGQTLVVDGGGRM